MAAAGDDAVILHQVLTPEKVPFTYRVAGLGARFLAWLIDSLLLAVLLVIGALFASVYENLREGFGILFMSVWMFGLTWGYYLLFEWLWSGQTPGKRLLGLRVIQWRGTSITFFEAAGRNILRFANIVPLFYALDFAVAANNRENRRLGDLLADTLVVHVERQGKPIQALTAATEADRVRLTFLRQRLSQLTRDQKETLLDLCLRRDQLRATERVRLFRATVNYLRERLDLAPGEFESDEKFVLQLAAVLSERVTV
jgi:uncharacterized RDD family membrane protein YckC